MKVVRGREGRGCDILFGITKERLQAQAAWNEHAYVNPDVNVAPGTELTSVSGKIMGDLKKSSGPYA